MSEVTKWKPVSQLEKSIFHATKKINPLDTLMEVMLQQEPKAKQVMDFAISDRTDDYLKKQLEKHARRKYSFLTDRKIQSEVGMALLMMGPCRVEGLEDFVLYRRKKERKKKNA